MPDLGQRAYLPSVLACCGNEQLSIHSLGPRRHLEPADEGVRPVGVGTQVAHKALIGWPAGLWAWGSRITLGLQSETLDPNLLIETRG